MTHHAHSTRSLMRFLLCAAALSFGASVMAEPTTLSLHTTGTGALYVGGRLANTVDTELLLDTGSGYVSLSRETFNRIKNDTGTRFLREIHGVLADGKGMAVPVYAIAELTLGVGCTLYDVEVAVMPSGSRDILGLNALRQMQPFTLQLDPPQLTANCVQDS